MKVELSIIFQKNGEYKGIFIVLNIKTLLYSVFSINIGCNLILIMAKPNFELPSKYINNKKF